MEREIALQLVSSVYISVKPRHSTELKTLLKGGFIIPTRAEFFQDFLAPFMHVANLTIMSMLTMYCPWGDQAAQERADHQPSYAKAKNDDVASNSYP